MRVCTCTHNVCMIYVLGKADGAVVGDAVVGKLGGGHTPQHKGVGGSEQSPVPARGALGMEAAQKAAHEPDGRNTGSRHHQRRTAWRDAA